MALATLLQNCNFNTNLDGPAVRPMHSHAVSANAQTTPSLNKRQRNDNYSDERTPDPDYNNQYRQQNIGSSVQFQPQQYQQQQQTQQTMQIQQPQQQIQYQPFQQNVKNVQNQAKQSQNLYNQNSTAPPSLSTLQLQLQQLTNLLTFEQEKSNSYLEELNQQKHENVSLQNEILRLQQQNLISEKQHAEALTTLRTQVSSGNDYKMQFSVQEAQLKQLQKELKTSENRAKKSEKAAKELIQLIEENSPSLKSNPSGKSTKTYSIQSNAIAKKPLNKDSDRAQKVLQQLKIEQNELRNDLNLIFQEGKSAPEVIGETDVVEMYRKMKDKQKSVKDLSKYRKQVQKLGVVVK